MAREKEPPMTAEINEAAAALSSTPAAPPLGLTFEQMLELAKAFGAGSAASAEAQAQALAKANAEVLNLALDRDKQELNFPDVSRFNPKGEKKHPRTELRGEIFWLGTRLQKEELTQAEIDLLNQIQPGLYHAGQWEVRDLAPGTRTRRLQIIFPNEDEDQRANLPQSMIAILQEIVAEATPAVVLA